MLDRNDEGFVVRFASGLRLKVKGLAYRQSHATLSRVTPLGVFDAMLAGDDLDALRREIPEEFWGDFDLLRRLLDDRLLDLTRRVDEAVAQHADLSDRDVGIRLAEGRVAEPAASLLFQRRRGGVTWLDSPRTRRSVMRAIRPTGNELPGYAPSLPILGLRDDG